MTRLFLGLAIGTFAVRSATAEESKAIAEPDASRSGPPASVRAGASAGVGFPLLWSVGPRLQVAPPIEMGGAYSRVFGWDFLGAEISVHFGDTDERPRPPMYMRVGFYRASKETADYKALDTLGAVSFGHEWFLGSHVAIELDGGLATTLSHKVTRKKPREPCEGEWCNFDLDLPSVDTLPSLHLGLVAYF